MTQIEHKELEEWIIIARRAEIKRQNRIKAQTELRAETEINEPERDECR